MTSALEELDRLREALRTRRLGLLLDYDGTLTPIVRRPEEALLAPATRSVLKRLSRLATVAVVSGRDRRDVEHMVGVDRLIYAGSHGMDIQGPGMRLEQPLARQALPALDQAERELRGGIEAFAGAHVERKRFSIAVHYREVEPDEAVGRIEALVDQVRSRHPALRKLGGKKVFELQPDVPWDKGEAVVWIAEQLKWSPQETLILYIGDDVTDEFAFRALRQRQLGLGIRVGDPSSASEAFYYLSDCRQVHTFLEALLTALSHDAHATA